MALTAEQYLAFSQIAYQDYDIVTDTGLTIHDFITKYTLPGNETAVLTGLAGVQDYTLVNFTSNPTSGFAAAAFQAPDDANGNPGEIVFAFRGTDNKNIYELVHDADDDLAIALDPNAIKVTQFDDAFDFWTDTLQQVGGASGYSNYSFTGHSLVSGLAHNRQPAVV